MRGTLAVTIQLGVLQVALSRPVKPLSLFLPGEFQEDGRWSLTVCMLGVLWYSGYWGISVRLDRRERKPVPMTQSRSAGQGK